MSLEPVNSVTAPQIIDVPEGAVRRASVDFRGQLDAGELLTGDPTVEEVDSEDLTIDQAAITAEAVVIVKRSVPAAQAVQFRVTGTVAGSTYSVRITAETDGGQTLIGFVTIRGI